MDGQYMRIFRKYRDDSDEDEDEDEEEGDDGGLYNPNPPAQWDDEDMDEYPVGAEVEAEVQQRRQQRNHAYPGPPVQQVSEQASEQLSAAEDFKPIGRLT